MKYLIISLTLLAFLLSACGPGCSSEQYLELVGPTLDKFDDQNTLTRSTPRGDLAPQINELQTIAREFKNLELPECYQPAHELAVQSMDETIEGYLAFMVQEPDVVVNNHFIQANQKYEASLNELLKLDLDDLNAP